MDTVALCDETKPLKLKRGRLSRPGSALGADDRAGINLIMNHYKRINFIFTRDEEIGRLGAKELVKHKPFLQDLKKVSCVIELDCTGHKKIRGAVHGYCMTDMVSDVKKVIPDITDTRGSYSDLDSFIPWKAGVNLSVGYYKQHTTSEYLVIKEYDYVNSIILDLDKQLRGEYEVYVAPPKRYWNYKTQDWQDKPMPPYVYTPPKKYTEKELV
ncbi:M28 family peptidase, partial [Candidatus Babeliales bacterium]|nr:M28 family peptidase [Candidatus Babeliales bacterium]